MQNCSTTLCHFIVSLSLSFFLIKYFFITIYLKRNLSVRRSTHTKTQKTTKKVKHRKTSSFEITSQHNHQRQKEASGQYSIKRTAFLKNGRSINLPNNIKATKMIFGGVESRHLLLYIY